jgi:hypothetical protein
MSVHTLFGFSRFALPCLVQPFEAVFGKRAEQSQSRRNDDDQGQDLEYFLEHCANPRQITSYLAKSPFIAIDLVGIPLKEQLSGNNKIGEDNKLEDGYAK